MFTALGWRVDEFGAGRLVVNPEGHFEVPPLLLFHCPKGRGAVALSPGEPGALPETLLGRPNGAKDCVLEEFFLEGKAPLRLHNEVNTDVDLERRHGEVLKNTQHTKKMKTKK